MKTVKECLALIGVTLEDFSECTSFPEEFAQIKKAYFKKVLVCHPDKGGDPAVFRDVQTSFEVLRDMYDGDYITSFATAAGQATAAESYEETWEDFSGMPTPSWDYYYAAAAQEEPIYRMEPAKSGRSACKQKGKAKKCTAEPPLIEMGELRIGSIDSISGSFGRWCHLPCWRVPSKVWLGLPDPETCKDTEQFATALLGMNEVLLCGFSELSPELKKDVVEYVMDKGNWARFTKRKKAPAAVSAAQAEQKVVPQGYHAPREPFTIPVPGQNGSQPDALEGKTFVLTGTFPELGGGTGFNLGKDKLKKMIQSFGGRVTSAVSGRTDFVAVGKEPGFGTVSKARERPKIQLINLKDLKEGIETGRLEDANPVVITEFSSGYRGNSLADTASAEALAIAAGTTAVPQLTEEPAKKKASSKKRAAAPDAKGSKSRKKKGPNKKRAAQDDKEESKSMPNEKKTKGSPKMSPAGEKEESSAIVMKITCDGCGVDCSERSWFVEQTKEDYCDKCHAENKKEGAVLQSKGVTV